MVPLGTKANIFAPTKKRLTWDYHTTEGFYLGPTKDHYRYQRIYIKEKTEEKTSDTVQFLPTHYKMPYASSIDEALAALKNLVAVTSKAKPDSPFSLKDDEIESIKQLEFFSNVGVHRRTQQNQVRAQQQQYLLGRSQQQKHLRE